MKSYKIIVGSGLAWCYVHYIAVESWECEQDALDKCIDLLEKLESSNILTLDEVEKQGYNDDEYIQGGNHGLCLLHYGVFSMEVVE